ncbi:hypothetical protein [Brevibacillus sp. NRS-1366]|uniref:hypothetical protein n=1 Tax=Brevibacillus sp. NRS-1366 TaxID=3233899 RepID=UPI003D1D8C33
MNERLPAKELADHCGVSIQLVRRFCETGEIKTESGMIPKSELRVNSICLHWIEEK